MANQGTENGKPIGPDAVIKTALARFALAEEAEAQIRKKALEELKFRAGEQWPDQVKQSRDLEMRPCLTVNQLPKFIRQVTNDARQNRPSIKILPTDDATEETADIIGGMCRQIQAASQADVAYDTACDLQATIGFGYFRVLTEYCSEDSFDQDIKIKRIKNPFTVYTDPGCQEHDDSDARWRFIVADLPKDDFKGSYTGTLGSSYDFSSTGDSSPGWCTEDYIRVAEYFEVTEEEKKIFLLKDGTVVDEDGLKSAGPVNVVKERTASVKKIIWRKITAFEVLEEQEWPGKYIPIVSVYGDDYDIDGKRVLKGMVADSMDTQRMYNYQTSAFTEALALAPKAPYVMAEGQDEGFERFWDTANTKNYSRLVYKPVTIGGQIAPAPQRQTAEPPVQAMALAIRQASEDLKATTGIYDASLGNRSNEQSGRAILARQKEGDVSNFHYIDNLSRSIRYLGVILVDLIPKIYDAARVVRILHEDGESELVKVNQEFDPNEKKGGQNSNVPGSPGAAALPGVPGAPPVPGMPPAAAPPNPPTDQPTADQTKQAVMKIYDLTTGRYDVVVTTGPSYSTRRQEAAQSMVEVTQAYPKMMDIAGDIMVKNMDWPGAQDVADRLKKLLPPNLQDQEPGDVSPQTQAQMKQMGDMIDHLTEALNKTQGTIDNKTAELESRERIANLNAETQLLIKKLDMGGAANAAILAKQLEDISTRLNMIGQNQPIQAEGSDDGSEGMPQDPSQALNPAPQGGSFDSGPKNVMIGNDATGVPPGTGS